MQHISHSTFTPNTYRYYECSSGRPLKKNIIVVFLFGSTDLTSSSTSVSILSTPHSNAQLGLSDLDRTVQNFFDRSIHFDIIAIWQRSLFGILLTVPASISATPRDYSLSVCCLPHKFVTRLPNCMSAVT